MTVLSNNCPGSKQAAEAMVAFLTERHGAPRGEILEVTGNLTQNFAQWRGGGFNDMMNRYPDITVIIRTGDQNSAKGIGIVRVVASTEADLDGLYMHSCTGSAGSRPALWPETSSRRTA